MFSEVTWQPTSFGRNKAKRHCVLRRRTKTADCWRSKSETRMRRTRGSETLAEQNRLLTQERKTIMRRISCISRWETRKFECRWNNARREWVDSPFHDIRQQKLRSPMWQRERKNRRYEKKHRFHETEVRSYGSKTVHDSDRAEDADVTVQKCKILIRTKNRHDWVQKRTRFTLNFEW